MKYIDADKIRNAIESEADNWQDTYTDCMRDNLLTILDSLQQEQPSLTDNLDDAARRYAIPAYMKDVDENYLDEYPYDPISESAFKAGAEWMSKQINNDN